MLEALRELFVKLGLDVDKAGFATAEAAVDALEGGVEKLVEGMEELAEKFVEIIEQTAEYSEAVADAAIKTGLSTDTIQAWGQAIQVTGGSVEGLEHALVRMQVAMQAAADGNTETAMGFARAGVKLWDPTTGKLRNVEAVMLDLSAGLSKLDGAAQRATAVKILGRPGAELLPFLTKGPEGIRELVDAQKALGNITDAETIQSQKEFAESLTQVKLTIAGLERELAGPLIEALAPIVEEVLGWVKANRALISSAILGFARALVTVGRAIVTVFTTIGKVGIFIAQNWRLLATILGAFLIAKIVLMKIALLDTLVAWALNTAAAIAYGAISVAAAVKSAAAWVASVAPIILVTAALALAFLAAEDFIGFLEGKDSVIGDWGKKWTAFLDQWTKAKPEDGWLLTKLKQAVALVTDLEGTLQRIGKFFGVNISHEDVAGALAGSKGYETSHKLINTITNPVGAALGLDPYQKIFGDQSTLAPSYWSGGAASPEESAARARNNAGVMWAPQISNQNTVKVEIPPGPYTLEEIGKAAGDGQRQALDRWWDEKMGETMAGTGSGG